MRKQPASSTPAKKETKKPTITEKEQKKTGIPQEEEPAMNRESVFRAFGSPAVILAPDHTILSANDTTCRIAGKTEKELRGMKCWVVFHGPGATGPPPGCPMVRLLASGRHETSEMEVAINNGIFLVSCSPVIDARGAISSIIHIATDVTEKKKAEWRVKESEERFRQIFENSPLGIALVTPDFRFFSVNPAWVAMTGYSEKELLKMSFKDITHPDHLAGDLEQILKLAAGKISVYATEKRYIRKDRSVLWGLLKVTTIRDQQGALRHFAAQIEDITSQKHAEQDLLQKNREIETLNQLAIEFASLPISTSVMELAAKKLMLVSGAVMTAFAVYDPAHQILRVTNLEIAPGILKKAIRLLGKRPEDMKIPVSTRMYQEIISTIVGTRKTLTEITFGDIPSLVSTSIQKMMGIDHFIGIAYVIEGELYGTSILAMKYGQSDPSTDFLESFAYLVALSLRRHRAEAMLAENEERYRTILEQAADAVLMHDENGRILEVNRKACESLGYSREELLSRSIADLDPDTIQAGKNELWGRVLAGEQFTFESHQKRRDGSTFPVEVTLGPVRLPSGPSVLGIVRDITERKLAEEQRERLIRELEQKNAELDRFTYTVSHDLKSPLLSLQAFIALLEDDIKSGNTGQVTTDIRRISESVEKLEHLITTLLVVSRSGRSVDMPVLIPVADLAREAAGLVDASLRERGVMLVIPDSLPTISGDRTRLLQVMTNLLDNAVKFMGDQKEPRVEVGIRSDAGTPVFFVRDNGIGFKKENLQKAFVLFERFNPDIPGTGIGLATVKRIIEAHGGRIWAESEGEGKGTTICVTLPAARDTGTDKNINK